MELGRIDRRVGRGMGGRGGRGRESGEGDVGRSRRRLGWGGVGVDRVWIVVDRVGGGGR